MADDKYYVSYNTVHKLVKSLAERIESSGFDPDVIVAIGSGGFIPARIIKTFISRPIYAVGISYYGVDNKHKSHPTKIQWIDEVADQLRGKKVLLIDEVDDTRATLGYCVGELLNYEPEEIAVLVLLNKQKKKDVEFPPEIKRYYPAMEIGDQWIKFPWDADDIEEHTEREKEMLNNKGKKL
ncbi:MAG: phosphoribosyltransferase [Sphaerochaetaceae bacterium]|nr:phosphoribosyltransferase [Sphaerochaetaceae bacterium]